MSSSSCSHLQSSNKIHKYSGNPGDYPEYVIRMEAYFDSKDWLEIVQQGVQGIAKDRTTVIMTIYHKIMMKKMFNHSFCKR